MESVISDRQTQDQSAVCNMCQVAAAKYTCPKCNQMYCTLECYRSEAHLECSEHFYKECLEEQLVNDGVSKLEAERKMQEILVRLHKASAEEEEEEKLDSDDDDDDDLAVRLAGIDLDDSERVWQRLNAAERLDFEAFLRSGDVSQFVAMWTPWWNAGEGIPKVWASISKFAAISAKPPATCVEHNLVNILAAYAFLARYFNGEHADFPLEFVAYAHNLSLCLRDAANFDSPRMAIESVRRQCVDNSALGIVADKDNVDLLRADAHAILDSKAYILAALSDLRQLLEAAGKLLKVTQARTGPFNTPVTAGFTKKHLRTTVRKVEYFLSFVNDKASL